MWRPVLALGVASMCWGCGGDGAGDEGSAQPDYKELIGDAVADYNRIMTLKCQCFVELGSYENEDECLALIGAGDDWVECGIRFAESVDGGVELVEQTAPCMHQASSASAECAEAAGCDLTAIAECMSNANQMSDQECGATDNDLTLMLLQYCPDLGLLSR